MTVKYDLTLFLGELFMDERFTKIKNIKEDLYRCPDLIT
ncbi:hypothetical protein CUZ96_1158 [Enterococcus lactis]|nr:hypothetical protein [Enterococcus lactis]